MESHSESEDSNMENRTESECYDGDVDTESYLFALSSSAVDRLSTCSITDPASYPRRSLTHQDKFQLLQSSMNLPGQTGFPVAAGRKFNPSWLRYSMKNNSLYCISCICFGGAMSLYVSNGFRNWGENIEETYIAILSSISIVRTTRLLKKK